MNAISPGQRIREIPVIPVFSSTSMQARFEALKELIPFSWEVFNTLPADAQESTLAMAEKNKEKEEEAKRREEEREEELEYYQRKEAVKKEAAKRAEKYPKAEGPKVKKQAVIGRGRKNPGREFKISESCEFPINEPDPVSYMTGMILSFRKQTILDLEARVTKLVKHVCSYKKKGVVRGPRAFMLFTLSTRGKTIASTKQVNAMVTDPVNCDPWEDQVDKLFYSLDVLLHYIQQARGGYGEIYTGGVSYVQFVFTAICYPTPGCVENWGNNLQDVELRKEFDIFTASDPNVSCILQCAKRIFGPDATESTLEEIEHRLNGNLYVFTLHYTTKGISNVEGYRDLAIDPFSPLKKFSVIDTDIKYLLHDKGHVGVLENLKEESRNRYKTSFRPLMKYAKCEKVTVVFDIESYFDPDGDQRHTPYLCCACFIIDDVPGDVVEFEGKKCVAEMIWHSAEFANVRNIRRLELIAHNGGGYDFHYVLSAIDNPETIKNILIRNNNIVSFHFEHEDILFYLKDSLNFLNCSLKRAAKAFLTESEGKTDFPHHEARSESSLQETFKEWISVDKIIDVKTEESKMLISAKHIINSSDNENYKKLVDWAKLYCCNDVIALAKVWIAFKKTIFDIFGCHVVEDTLTLAGMSFRLFEAHLPQRVKLEHQSKGVYDDMRGALYGGRCISLNGIYEDVACLDVKSLYPAAMAYYDQPYGRTRRVTKRVLGELGIYHVKVIPVQRKQHGFFPMRYAGKVGYAVTDLEPYTAWYTSVDIDIGVSEGHKFEYVPFDDEKCVGYSWQHKGLIFKEYIEGVLYKLKLQYEQEGNQEKRWAIKIIMNSLWGKFAQKWMDISYSVENKDSYLGPEDWDTRDAYPIFDTDNVLVKTHEESPYSQKPIQNGVFVLSWARHHMKRIWDACAKPGAVCVYSDTDSIFVSKDDINEKATFELNGQVVPVIGEEMGQLELEHTFDSLMCVGKKQYMGSYFDKEGRLCYKKRFKGVPADYVKPELFTHLIESKDNTAQIEFLKFKREWGCVSGYNDSKNVSQT
jgi:hypothetical protein